MYNFTVEHSILDSLLEKSKNKRYFRDFYLGIKSRGAYSKDVKNKASFKTIEKQLNSNMTLKELCCISILNTDCKYEQVIDLVPKDLYKVFLKCAIYTLHDYAVECLIKKWPFECLELGSYLQEAYSSLLVFYDAEYHADFSPIDNDMLIWMVIGSKYADLIFKTLIKSFYKPECKLTILDLTNIPISDNLFKKIVNTFKKLNSECDFKKEKEESEKKKLKCDLMTPSSSEETTSDDDSDADTDDIDFDSILNDSDESDDEEDDEDEGSSESYETDSNSIYESESESNLVAFGSSESESSDTELKSSWLIQLDLEAIKACNKKLKLGFDLTFSCKKLASYLNELINCINMKEKYPNLKLEISLNRLDLTIIDDRVFSNLLVDNNMKLNGLGIFFGARRMYFAASLVEKFNTISELVFCVCGDGTHILENQAVRNKVIEAFENLKHLKRLKLDLPITNHNVYETIFSKLEKPLEYLNLASCNLSKFNFEQFIDSKHAHSLTNLNLNDTDIANQTENVVKLLRKCASTLQIVNLGLNNFRFEDYLRITNEIVKMPNLKMLFTCQRYNLEEYLRIASKLTDLASLISWRIEYSTDIVNEIISMKNKYKIRRKRKEYRELFSKIFNGRVKIIINEVGLDLALTFL